LWAFTGTDQTELRDIMEARVLLERDLAGLAAERGSVEEVEQIGCAARAMKEHFIAGRQILNAEMSFHLAVAAAAHNEVLTNAVQLLRNLTRQWIQLRLTTPRVPQKVIKQHQEVYEAIRLHDPERARAAMWAHVSETSVSVATVVAQRSKSTGDLRVSKSLIAVR
jgi:DNA-binding FadR family transcriptional regulator